MRADIVKSLVAVRAPDTFLSEAYDLGFFAIGYERRSIFVASSLARNTKALCGFEYQTSALAIAENKKWAATSGVRVKGLSDYRIDKEGSFRNFVGRMIEQNTRAGAFNRLFVDVSSMDRSLIARLLLSIFSVLELPFTLRLCYAPAAFVEPQYVFMPTRECAPAIPELSGKLGIHQSSVTLLLGLGFEYGVSLGLLEQLEPDNAIIFVPKGIDVRYDDAVKKANFGFDFGLENVRLVPFQVNQPLVLFESLFSISAEASISHRIIIAPNGPKIFAALATIVGLFRAPRVTILRASLASQPPSHHVDADGSIVAIDFTCQ